MKSKLIITAISLSAMFGTTATAQMYDAEPDNMLLAANRGSGSSRGASGSNSSSNYNASGNTTKSSQGYSSSSTSSGNGGRGSLQHSSRGGSDSRGTRPSSSSSSESSSSSSSSSGSNAVRNNPQPHHHRSEVRGHHHHDDVIIYESVPVEEYVVETAAPSEPIIEGRIEPIMCDAYFGLNFSSMDDNDEHIGFSAGISGEFGMPRSGYYGRVGARYTKQNYSVCYGNDWFPDDMSDISIKALQIPVTLAGYRFGGEDICAGIGIGLIYQHGLGGTTKSEYHTQDFWDWRYEPYPEPIRERKNTFKAGLMSTNDLLGMLELYFRVDRITILGEVSTSFLCDNRFPNKYINWDCSRDLSATSVLLTIGYRLY